MIADNPPSLTVRTAPSLLLHLDGDDGPGPVLQSTSTARARAKGRQMNQASTQAGPESAATWLSIDFTSLAQQLQAMEDRGADADGYQFDVIIVGSGYGGGMALEALAGFGRDDAQRGSQAKPSGQLRIAVLERGDEFLPGAFPSRLADLPGQVRFSQAGSPSVRGKTNGLYDLRTGGDMGVLVANGLGGGSLINAGVMARPRPSVFQDGRWPREIRGDPHLTSCLRRMQHRLGATPARDAGGRQAVMDGIRKSKAAAITIVPADARNPGSDLKPCIACGDCFSGCNFGAKRSIDVGSLARARRRHDPDRLKIVTGATVRTFMAFSKGKDKGEGEGEDKDHGWELAVEHTDPRLTTRAKVSCRLTTRLLIVCAGSLGSTELLMRARADGLTTSAWLGRGFSGNGDNIVLLDGTAQPVQAVADEDKIFAARKIGPTITRTIDLRDDPDSPCVIQDLAIPGPLQRLFQEVAAYTAAMDRLMDVDSSRYADRDQRPDPNGFAPGQVDRALVLSVIGSDDASGELHLPDDLADAGVGTLTVSWPGIASDRDVDLMLARVAEHARADYQSAAGSRPGPGGSPDRPGRAGPFRLAVRRNARRLGRAFVLAWRGLRFGLSLVADGLDRLPDLVWGPAPQADATAAPRPRLRANPLWRPLPASVEQMLGAGAGTAITVHPLGGCRMGDSIDQGVVDHLGRVFRSRADPAAAPDSDAHFHPGLVILDGAIIPTALGINPALTIATLAQRAIRKLRRHHWHLVRCRPGQAPRLPPRPWFARLDAQAERAQEQTRFEFTEEMRTDLDLGNPRWQRARASVELWFKPVTLTDLIAPAAPRRLQVDADRSRLKITARPGSDPALPRVLLLEAPLAGTMTLFSHGPSSRPRRIARAVYAWVLNRAIRDLFSGNVFQTLASGALESLATNTANLASRAGDHRLLDYALTVGKPTLIADAAVGGIEAWADQAITATKTLTYGRRSNPVVQFLEARLNDFPAPALTRPGPKLTVHLPYFGQAAIPLIRIVDQQDQVRGLVDYASLLAYFGRTLLPLHAWSFRLPDRPTEALPTHPRLPRRIPGLEPPIITWLTTPDGERLRLAHYRPPKGLAARPDPVLAVHGYSASGTTFAHEALPEGGLAGALCRRGHHVWVVDLRSSAGLATAEKAWTFDEMGAEDLPMAVDHVFRHHLVANPSDPNIQRDPKVQIVAHCMGGAMLSLGLRTAPSGQAGKTDTDPDTDPLPVARAEAMAKQIGRIVFSQVGPAVTMSAANIGRAYVTQWLRYWIDLPAIRFRPSDRPGPAEQMLDRLLCLVPYPPADFDRENPLWPPWRATPWVAQRHRMDAVYGVTFDVQAISDTVLNRIDEFFGPSNLQTTAQVIWFARSDLVTDSRGRAAFATPGAMQAFQDRPVLTLHATRNGLVDPDATAINLPALLTAAGARVTTKRIDAGHQDSLIGRDAARTYGLIGDFLEAEDVPPQVQGSAATTKLEPVRVRKARAITRWVRLESIHGDAIRGTAGFESANGAPSDVAILPVVPAECTDASHRTAAAGAAAGTACRCPRRWLLKGPDGQALARPTAADINAVTRGGDITPKDDETVEIVAQRPPGHDGACLLLLLHEQIEAIGDSAHRRDPPPADAVSEALGEAFGEALGEALGEVGAASLADARSKAIITCLVGRPASELDAGVIPGPAESSALTPPPLELPELLELLEQLPNRRARTAFALGSCQYPGGIVDGSVRVRDSLLNDVDIGPADRALSRLAGRCETDATIRAAIFCGDLVYVDATAGLFDPKCQLDALDFAYSRLASNRGLDRLKRQGVELYPLIDDHEIRDNFEQGKELEKALSYYLKWLRPMWPQKRRGLTEPVSLPGQERRERQDGCPLWDSRSIAGYAFFLADTRADRAPARHLGNWQTATLISDDQMSDLKHWIAAQAAMPVPEPAFIVSPSMLLPRLQKLVGASQGGDSDAGALALHIDAWPGYPDSLHEVLTAIFEHQAGNIVFLSGDEHVSSITRITISDDRPTSTALPPVTVYSIHSSGLYAPLPFANSRPQDFASEDVFRFPVTRPRSDRLGAMGPTTLVCEVAVQWAEGDGFAIIEPRNNGDGSWTIDVDFDRVDGVDADEAAPGDGQPKAQHFSFDLAGA